MSFQSSSKQCNRICRFYREGFRNIVLISIVSTHKEIVHNVVRKYDTMTMIDGSCTELFTGRFAKEGNPLLHRKVIEASISF